MVNITVIIFILLRILSFIVINIYDSRNLLVDQFRAKPWQPFETYLILLSCWCDKKHYNKEQLKWGRVYLGSWFQKDESLLLWGGTAAGSRHPGQSMKLRDCIFNYKRETESVWKCGGALESQASSQWHVSSIKAAPDSQTAPPSGDQVLKYPSLWGAFSFKPLQWPSVFFFFPFENQSSSTFSEEF